MYIDLIAGARPNFMKIAPIIHAIKTRMEMGANIQYRLIHTGQHYDKAMSQSFFDQLDIPEPHVNLGAGGGTQAEQTASIMIGYEKLLQEDKCDLCLVVGDVTSTMACAIVAQKMNVKVAHVEGGIRSGDWTMPEEINRLVTDSITDYFFTTTESAGTNLIKAGVPNEKIFWVGNTMIDTLRKNEPRFQQPDFWNKFQLEKKKFIVMTLHRPSNVDEESHFKHLLQVILDETNNYPIIFPVHPRTKKVLDRLIQDGLTGDNLLLVDPLGYLEFNYLVKNAAIVITDSGGITEETTVLGVPCITLRNNTERPETVEVGTNELVGTDPINVKRAIKGFFNDGWKSGAIPEKWDGNTAPRIVSILEDLFK